jgi:hypothetical protein
LGIDVGASAQGRSGILIVTRRMLEEGIKKLELQTGVMVISRRDFGAMEGVQQGWRVPTPLEVQRSGIEGNIQVLAKSKYCAYPSTKSKIVPSVLHNKITKATTKPCILDVNKMEENMNKYATPSLPFPQKYVEEAAASVVDELSQKETIRLERVLTVKEAINGVLGMPYIDSLDMTTSAGFPFVGENMKGKKEQLFERVEKDGEEYWMPRPDLHRLIVSIHVMIADKIYPDFPYTNTLKDERKDNEDVDKGKVRMFSMSSCAYAIVMRQYFLPTIAHLYQCRRDTFLTIGMDKTSKEWDSFVRRMLEVSNKFHDGDYKKFDTRASLEVRYALNRLFIPSWMTDVQKTSAEVLLRYDGQALHQYFDYILVIPSGTSSGSILTAIIGSLINECYIRMAWLHIFELSSLRDLRYYRTFVRSKNYGDDLVLTVADEIKDVFNCATIADFLAMYDITMTSGDKTGEFREKEISEFTFLRHNTGVLFGSYVPLAKDPAEQINWYKKGNHSETPEVACENNCNSALRATFFFGKERFTDLRDKILRERPDYNLLSWYSLRDEFLNFGKLCDVEGTFAFGESRMTLDSLKSYFANASI